MRTKLAGLVSVGSRQLLLGFGLGSLIVLLALALWPRSGVSGTTSAWVCRTSSSGSLECSAQEVQAAITINRWPATGPVLSGTRMETWDLKTDASGHFHLDLPAGGYLLSVVALERSYANFSFPVYPGRVTQVQPLLMESLGLAQCLPGTDLIQTPTGPVAIEKLQPGMLVWTMDAAGRRLAVPIVTIRHLPTPAGYRVKRLTLADGRTLEASAGHPTVTGRPVGDLSVGDSLDDSQVLKIEEVPYSGDTWDILPASPTGLYWANDVLLRSTLLR